MGSAWGGTAPHPGGHTGQIPALAVSGNGQVAVSAGADGTVRVREAQSGHCRHVLCGHTARVKEVAVTVDDRSGCRLETTTPSGSGTCSPANAVKCAPDARPPSTPG
ncbi:WD40 repeat domain-containing protein [Spirillospora sp. CA-108201]